MAQVIQLDSSKTPVFVTVASPSTGAGVIVPFLQELDTHAHALMKHAEPKKAASGSSPASSQPGNSQFEQDVSKILLSLGIYMAQIVNEENTATMTQAQVSQQIAQASETQTNTYVGQIKAQQEAQAQASSGFWGHFDAIFGNKWVQIGLTVCVGLLLCETPIGFAMLAATIALQASGVLAKASSGLGSEIAKIPGMSGSAANFIASIVVIAAMTAAGGFAEGAGMMALTKGLSALATVVPEEMAPAVTKLLTLCTEKVAAQTAENGAANAVENTVDKTADNSSYFKFGNATKMALTTTIGATMPFVSLLQWCQMSQDNADLWGSIFSELAALAIMGLAASKGGVSNIQELLTQNVSKGVKIATLSAESGSAIFSALATGDKGYNELQFANLLNDGAPITGQTKSLQALTQFFSQMISMGQSQIKSLLEAEAGLNQINLGYGWETVAQGMQA